MSAHRDLDPTASCPSCLSFKSAKAQAAALANESRTAPGSPPWMTIYFRRLQEIS